MEGSEFGMGEAVIGRYGVGTFANCSGWLA